MKPGDSLAIQQMFDSISSKYDLLNDIFSFGLHRVWKSRLISLLDPSEGERWIDLCCGTGDMSILLAEKMNSSDNISGLDSALNVLSIARERSRGKYSSIKWIKGDALETNLPSNQFDGLLMAYGLRNLSNYSLGFKEAHRLLKPGGRAGFLDFRSFDRLSLQGLFQKYYLSFYVEPIASLFGLGLEYSYIKKSLENFPSGLKQKHLALDAGFKKAEFKLLANGQMGVLLLEA